jgi:UDP-N-acetylglucosamine 2-epimerase (non-hydrolysing)
MTSCLAHWHFAPTERARAALLREGQDPAMVHVVGNTVIDALLSKLPEVRARAAELVPQLTEWPAEQRVVLVTGHRRESFGPGFERICAAIRRLALAHPELRIVYPVHLNPNVAGPVRSILGTVPNVSLLEPLDYLAFIAVMDRCHLILTDSGGIQEEAPSLGKPLLVMRDTTERQEAVDAGVAVLVGTDEEAIFGAADGLLRDSERHAAMARGANPYGVGDSSRRIVDILKTEWSNG